MTWLAHHSASEALAADAEVATRQGDLKGARDLYAKAAVAEVKALDDLDQTKSRTLGVSAVSAAALFYKAADLKSAEAVALRWLSSGALPKFATDDLRNLLQSVWSEQVRERAGVQFAPGQVMVSVKGGEIVEGGAPLDLILDKVQVVQSLFYRTAELLRHLPHRKHGPPSKEIQDSCRPWLFQTAPGSYQFAVAIQEPRQLDLFDLDAPAPAQVADMFLKILRAGIDDPDQYLAELVPDGEYRGTFLKLTRNLAPSGKVFDQLEVRASDATQSIRLEPETRKTVNAAIRRTRPPVGDIAATTETLTGVLRAVHLDKDWLEITVDGDHIQVQQVGEAVDDVIGPMVNRRVVLEVQVDAKGRRSFVDIEPEQ